MSAVSAHPTAIDVPAGPDAADAGAAAGGEPMISLKDVHKVYRLSDGSEVRALDGLSLEIQPGTIHGIVGTSGAGKSTLVRCLTSLEPVTSGTVRVAGKDMSSLSARELREARRSIGMVFQHANLLEQRTTAQNIAYPLAMAGVRKGSRHETVAKMLREARRSIGMVFQHANLLEQRTTAQNIAYPLAMAGVRKGSRHETVAKMLREA
ncbi:MAG: ATP-binding cassette domain-containing protein, partial [Actinomyces urogenitalis]|uniref:ATP-binding cassette domain-containing protein n=1 Tax=Actinomyces urogenitalis TaxID=103621 RepID=UPI002A7F95C5